MITLLLLVALVGNACGTGVSVGDLVYDLTVKTSGWWWSGTEDTVAIQLVGDVAPGSWSSYPGDENDRFDRKSEDRLRYASKNIGHVTKVNAQLINVGRSLDKWKLDYIDVSINSSTYRAYFYFHFTHDREVHSTEDIKVVKCGPGYQKVQMGKVEICGDIDECETACNQRGMVCKNLPGEYLCSCENGLEMINGNCQDINECQGINSCSKVNTKCHNIFGSYECKCEQGYQRNSISGLCEDINECESHTNNCHQTCENTDGSFQCGCNKGWKLRSDSRTCIDADDCGVGKNPCDPETSECYDLKGAYRCICKHGYKQIPNTQKCEPVTCKAMISRPHMVASHKRCIVDGETKKGEKCSVSCREGYELKAQSGHSFICSKNGNFEMVEDLYEPKCIPKLCPKMKNPENGMVVPYFCATTGMHHGGKCSFYCKGGYKLYGNVKEVICSDTKYSPSNYSNRTVCGKVPEIACPGDIRLRLPADSEKASIGIHFRGASTNMETYETNPKGADAEYGFDIGKHTVEYIARNQYGDVAKCRYRVEVIDDKPPVKVFCPQDMYYQVKNQKGVMIRWPEPIFKDNVRIVKTHSNFVNGKLHKPTSFNVVYDAYDEKNNVATCQFKVHIDLITCSFDKIKGGDQATMKRCYNVGARSLCSMMCPSGKTLHHIPEGVMMKGRWFCSNGEWLQQDKVLKRLPDCVDSVPNPTKTDCEKGFVKTFDMFTHQPACGKCPRGTRYNGGVCLPCPEHHYQDMEGQLQCKKCPAGKGSASLRNKNVEDCIELCLPGTHSRTGFPENGGKCTMCPLNTYNSDYGSIECNNCPFGSMTELTGNNHRDLCIPIKDQIFSIPALTNISIKNGEDRQIGCLVNSRKKVTIYWQLPNGIKLGSNMSIKSSSLERPTLGQVKNCTQYISTLYFQNPSNGISGGYSCVVSYKGQDKEEKKEFEISVVDKAS